MPNIFDGIRNISDADVKEQVAVLETINMMNVSKPMVGKVTKNIVKVTNKLGVLLGKSSAIREPEVKTIWDLVDEKRGELDRCTRKELDIRFKKALVSKIKNVKETDSFDAISVKVINEASNLFNISEELTPGQKADIIKDRFIERMLVNLQKRLKNQDNEEAKRAKEALNIEKLTGLAGGRLILGLASYQIINGNKKLNRELLAQIVWLAVSSYGENFTPKVPWESIEEKIKREKEYERYNKLVKEKNKIKRKMKEQNRRIKDLEEQQRINSQFIKNEIYKREQAEKELSRLRIKKEDLEEKIKSVRAELENYNAGTLYEKELRVKELEKELEETQIEIRSNNTIIQEASDEIKNNEKKIEELINENYILKSKGSELNQELNVSKEKLNKKNEGRRKELNKRWNIFFDKCKIDERAIRDALNFTTEEIYNIEKVILELQGTNDPKSLSRGILYDNGDNYEHIEIKLHNGQPGRIKYDILKNQEKKIRIMEIYNHNQKRFS